MEDESNLLDTAEPSPYAPARGIGGADLGLDRGREEQAAFYRLVPGRKAIQRRRRGIGLRVLFAVLLIPFLIGTAGYVAICRFPSFAQHRFASNHAIHPTVVPGGIAFCDGLGPNTADKVNLAIDVMKSTGIGPMLAEILVESHTCIAIGDRDALPGTTSVHFDEATERSQHVISLSSSVVNEADSDELAALIVHEAVHVERSINRLDCSAQSHCVLSVSGDVPDEMAARRAEALWWLARHGSRGTTGGGTYVGTQFSAFENQLLAHYLAGGVEWVDYVTTLPSDGMTKPIGGVLPTFLMTPDHP